MSGRWIIALTAVALIAAVYSRESKNEAREERAPSSSHKEDPSDPPVSTDQEKPQAPVELSEIEFAALEQEAKQISAEDNLEITIEKAGAGVRMTVKAKKDPHESEDTSMVVTSQSDNQELLKELQEKYSDPVEISRDEEDLLSQLRGSVDRAD